jgi:hypothetical protein
VPISFEVTTTYWIARGIGPVQIESSGMEVESIIKDMLPKQAATTSTLIFYSNAK